MRDGRGCWEGINVLGGFRVLGGFSRGFVLESYSWRLEFCFMFKVGFSGLFYVVW